MYIDKDSRRLPVDTERKQRVMVELAKRGWSITDLANHIGVSQPFASSIISGRKRYPGCEHKIAQALCMPAEFLFPPRSLKELDDMRQNENRKKLRGAA